MLLKKMSGNKRNVFVILDIGSSLYQQTLQNILFAGYLRFLVNSSIVRIFSCS